MSPDALPVLAGEIGDIGFPARALVTRGAERERAYKVLIDQMPVGSHQEQAGREIPVVILRRVR